MKEPVCPARKLCLHSWVSTTPRFEARTDEHGEIIRYDDQDGALWNEELIAEGHYYLNKASRGRELSRYHLEAAVAYWHTNKQDHAVKWESILKLYNQLLCLEYSPVAALNRTYALSKIFGKGQVIEEAEKLGLTNYHLYHVLPGYLYTGTDHMKATGHLKTALIPAKTEKERSLIRKDLEKFGNLKN